MVSPSDRSREHTGISRSRSRSREHVGISMSRSRSREPRSPRSGTQSPVYSPHTGISRSRSRSREHAGISRSRSRSPRSGTQSPVYSPSPYYSPNCTQFGDEGPEAGNRNQSETAVVLSEPNVLDCPFCLDPLSPPVYQCMQGHLACWSCSRNREKSCPSCRTPIRYRCTAIEQVLESAKTPCRNRERGCTETISYSWKFGHENSCKYNACSCPYDDCNYVGLYNRLYRHFSARHSHAVENFEMNIPVRIYLYKNNHRVFLQESNGSTVFVLNRKIEPRGSLFNIVCIAPQPSPSDAQYTYKLTTCERDRSICLRSNIVATLDCSTTSPEPQCLLITNDFADEREMFSLKLKITEH